MARIDRNADNVTKFRVRLRKLADKLSNVFEEAEFVDIEKQFEHCRPFLNSNVTPELIRCITALKETLQSYSVYSELHTPQDVDESDEMIVELRGRIISLEDDVNYLKEELDKKCKENEELREEINGLKNIQSIPYQPYQPLQPQPYQPYTPNSPWTPYPPTVWYTTYTNRM